jgi:signal transduction histidine kinase
MGMISHEIRSPLNIISLFSKKIGQSIKDDNLKDNFKSIEFTTNSLLLLSNQILEYSKNEGQKLTLQNKKFNLEEEVKNILSTISSFVESKKNTLNIKIDLNSNEEVYGDVTKIHQLFYNIIGNANKFTENGIIEVLVTQKIISDFELECNVTIQDNGIGISRDELANVFNSFYQANNQNTRELGIGLGLNLCKEIVELFDGTIAIESQENEGTKVSFNIILTRN